MPFRNAIARLTLNDARRFEEETVATLRGILGVAEDAATREVIGRIISEEEAHLRELGAELARVGSSAPPPEPRPDLPAPPDAKVRGGTICEQLMDVLDKERASAAFYSLLAERTLIPGIRSLFQRISEQERGHAEALEGHIRGLCAGQG